MITATARKHIIRALRQALRIRECTAREILEVIRNENALRLLEGRDMRTVKALVCASSEPSPTACLYVDDGQGYERTGVSLRLTYEDLDRWNVLSLEDAYAIAGEISANAGPELRALDERLAAESAQAIAANDDMLPEEAMDAVFGPVPESRSYEWMDGTVLRADVASSDDHVVALVELADGERRTMAMFPLFSGVADLASYAIGKVGMPARLCVGRVNAFDNDVPAGFDRSMPVLDMIVDRRDVPGLVRLYRKAA